jgi:DNA-directed RNA polymerase specialized sigma24 family protein
MSETELTSNEAQEAEAAEKKIRPRDRPHYVSNPVLYKAYCDWHIEILKASKEGKERPEMPKFIAESIMKICTRLAYRPNFINYSYRDEMIGDAIENCFRTATNFNPEKSINPFSFITTIAFNAFLRRIQSEQRQTHIKSKLIEELPIEELMDMQDHDEETMQHHHQFIDFLRENSFTKSPVETPRKKKKKLLHEEIGLEEFFDGAIEQQQEPDSGD